MAKEDNGEKRCLALSYGGTARIPDRRTLDQVPESRLPVSVYVRNSSYVVPECWTAPLRASRSGLLPDAAPCVRSFLVCVAGARVPAFL